MPWALAAGLALGTAWFAQLYVVDRSESELLRGRAALVEISLQSAQQQLEAERIITRQQLATLEQQITALTNDLRTQADLANLKITPLASMLNNFPQALAVAVWNPNRQEGVLKVEKLPALLPSQDYQLWVVDPQYPDPVDGGVFTVSPETGQARFIFKVRQRVGTVEAFAITLECKGGVPKAEGPFVLLGR
jgi:anti-sigma-K factor RskA